MATNFADRLFGAVEEKNSRVCVGLDPRVSQLPPPILEQYPNAAEAVVAFCRDICAAVAEHAAVVKLQSAYFETLGRSAFSTLWAVVAEAHRAGLPAIVDAKRGDIGPTAEAYAQAFFGGEIAADALTVNPYLGSDGIMPFVDAAEEKGAGVFVLVKTSNPSSGDLQDLRLEGGYHRVYQHVGEEVRLMGAHLRGECGYSAVGAVVGATYPEQLAELRRDLPGVPFLVPGYGAQGAGPEEVVAAFDKDGWGAVVNASRSIIFAYQGGDGEPEQFAQAAGEAAREMKDAINGAIGG